MRVFSEGETWRAVIWLPHGFLPLKELAVIGFRGEEMAPATSFKG